MCGRTSLFRPQPEIERRFDATFDRDVEPRYNIAPGDELSVVHEADQDTLTVDEWGFVPSWADAFDAGPRPINARAETIREHDLFRSAFENRRALVIADGFYEWAGERGGKQPFRVAREGNALFAMAGIWSRWTGNGEERRTVAIITTEANEVVEPIHDRMPVILPPDRESAWLEPESLERAKALLRPSDAADLERYPISTVVNDPSNDSPAVIEPVGGERGQTELGSFGTK
ncbi:MAG: SOS response-associated peptidase [Halodesulfurarchaeum sp.]